MVRVRGGAIQFLGTKRHHDEWLRDTENYAVKGCFAMTELGHGSNVCETVKVVYIVSSVLSNEMNANHHPGMLIGCLLYDFPGPRY